MSEVVTYQGKQLPVNYVAACQALALCVKIDECKDWEDKAAAIAAYAAQQENPGMERDAKEIRLRAARRIGELLPTPVQAKAAVSFSAGAYRGALKRPLSAEVRAVIREEAKHTTNKAAIARAAGVSPAVVPTVLKTPEKVYEKRHAAAQETASIMAAAKKAGITGTKISVYRAVAAIPKARFEAAAKSNRPPAPTAVLVEHRLKSHSGTYNRLQTSAGLSSVMFRNVLKATPAVQAADGLTLDELEEIRPAMREIAKWAEVFEIAVKKRLKER
jgi:hypothetical protein